MKRIDYSDYQDEGSSLGRFWYNIIGSDGFLIDLAVRGTLSLMVVVGLIYAPIISGRWIEFFITSTIFLFIHNMFSAYVEDEPVWRIGDYEFLSEDLIVYTNLMVYCLTNIYYV